ncbi:MAG: FHA domain-containing protein [Candidatus Aminicenantes bacterium]|nr:FHA domain-containing protein [Candidatus Aminicenantes bacterium]
MPNIQVTNTDGRISNFSILKDMIVIGRSEENDLVLPDQSVSRNHARITKEEKGYVLTDLGSFNGTKVYGKPIQSIRLKNNDEIKIGKIMLKFTTGQKPAQSPVQTVVLTKEREQEKGHSTIIESRADESGRLDSQDLLISTGIGKSPEESDSLLPSDKASQPPEVRKELLSLERMNKVLFVLYEISRQLHLIHDFNELLKKIMDLIFMVIDADYGFVILTGDDEKDELAPVVVKYKDDKVKGKGGIRASRTIINKVVNDKVALLTTDAMADTRLEQAQSLFSQKIRSAMCVPLWKKNEVIGVIQLDSVRFNNQFTEDDLELLKAIGCQMAMVIEQASLNEQIREEEQMISRLERYHSPQIIEMILKGGQETKENIMEPKDLTATIFFTDIIGFTPLSEHMPPREINLLLNQFFSRMTDIIFKHDGTLDKYIGDSLMAVFGAPIEKKNDPERAILAALEIKRELTAIMKKTEPGKKFNIRIGINTGRVVAGNIGSPNRMEYTVIGDPVNIASRLESIAEPNQILVGEETYKHVKRKFKIKKVGPKKVKGRTAEVMVYEVLG